ncbi:Hypothetical protein PHPALM_15704 [Phytophthora palmivora]|uniref:Uncharacterized protein n=1 Tax=Phytophthora palmivora TaxID=4796 RepID=A0A2P4XRI0_9STRA|nr:Hypothetical protein PHPALM_15704 [Phytophthora palmivora]
MATSLRDENQRLRAQLKNCDLNYQRVEQQIAELQSRMCKAEAEAARQLRLKEAEWMAEYDRSVQALLKIVQHHENEEMQLRAEVERLREVAATISPAITKITRSTQTEETSKQVLKRNSVTFAKVDKEDVDIRAKSNFTRMQVSSQDRFTLPK